MHSLGSRKWNSGMSQSSWSLPQMATLAPRDHRVWRMAAGVLASWWVMTLAACGESAGMHRYVAGWAAWEACRTVAHGPVRGRTHHMRDSRQGTAVACGLRQARVPPLLTSARLRDGCLVHYIPRLHHGSKQRVRFGGCHPGVPSPATSATTPSSRCQLHCVGTCSIWL